MERKGLHQHLNDVGTFRALMGGNKHDIGLPCGDVRDIFFKITVVAGQERKTQPVRFHNRRGKIIEGITVIHLLHMDFAVRQMLLVIISGDLSPAVENPRRVPVSSADVRGIIDCDNGIAAPGGFDGGVNQELRMFLRIGNAFPLRENRRRIGIFGKKNQVDGGIALFQSLNGKVNRRIRLFQSVRVRRLNRAEFHFISFLSNVFLLSAPRPFRNRK